LIAGSQSGYDLHMKLNALLSAVALVALLAGCAMFGEVVVPPDLDTYEGLAASLARGDDIFVYDVRTPEEYITGHIPGSINIPHGEIAEKLPFWKKSDVIVVYCASGGRSYMAYEALTNKGFKYVTDFGGIGNWQGDLVEGSDPE
jgi:rhodanese-related sulfurtransferase